MSLKSSLEALKAAKPRNFKDWLVVADPDDKELVLEAINDLSLPVNSLAVTLTSNGIPITRETILKLRDDAH